MTAQTHREALIKAGKLILQRAIAAKARGEIKDYIPVYREEDPEIIVYVQLVK